MPVPQPIAATSSVPLPSSRPRRTCRPSGVAYVTGEPRAPEVVWGNTCTPTELTPTTTSARPSPVMSPTATDSTRFGYEPAVAYETGAASAPDEVCASTQSRKSTDCVARVAVRHHDVRAPVARDVAGRDSRGLRNRRKRLVGRENRTGRRGDARDEHRRDERGDECQPPHSHHSQANHGSTGRHLAECPVGYTICAPAPAGSR